MSNYNRLEINSENLIHNLDIIKEKIGSESLISVVLKANGYGIGLVEAAKMFDTQGINTFCVAKANEAFLLRDCGFNQEIIVLGSVELENLQKCIEENIVTVIHDKESIKRILAVKLNNSVPRVHVKVNSGMNRLGFNSLDEIQKIFLDDKLNQKIKIEGIFSHLSRVHNDRGFTLNQINKFQSVIDDLNQLGVELKCVHLLASGGILKYDEYKYDMVRAGCALYGLLPDREEYSEYGFKDVVSLHTEVIQIHNLSIGESVGYDSTYITEKPTRIAILPIGYADGYPRRLSNQGKVIIRDEYYPIVGNISMDMCAVDITGASNIEVGEKVILCGTSGNCSIKINDIACLVDTVRTEILLNISDRVQRIVI